jgi:alcohol dehydrogenase class IV
VIDTAKALAAARGGRVCAVPTTLSGAEMTGGHRLVPGYEERGRHRPVLVLADPVLMTGQTEPDRRASAMNALAHAAEALYGPGRNPVASMVAAAAAGMIAQGLAEPTPDAGERLALGALLSAYAMDSAGYSLHHVLCQTIVRMCGTPHAATNAAMLPHVVRAMRGREPAAVAALADALDVPAEGLAERLAEIGAAGSLQALGVEADALGAVADAALDRSELRGMTPPPDRAELLSLLRQAYLG